MALRPLTLALVAALALAGPAAAAGTRVAFPAGAAPSGDIVISVSQRRLYLVGDDGTALRYRVAVGKPGKQWFGAREIDGKYLSPAWSPPEDVRRDNPRIPDVIAGGSPGNPMGVAALTLSGGEYAIHGTNRPASIGTFASYGCIRMLNADVSDLFSRVSVGTPVVVTP